MRKPKSTLQLVSPQKSNADRNKVKTTKNKVKNLKKEISQYYDNNGFLSWSSSKRKYIILGTNSPKTGLVVCPQCNLGQLMIIKSKKTKKRFIGCSNYYNGCRASSPLIQKAMLKGTKISCFKCSWPIILFRYTRKQKWIKRCSNFECKTTFTRS